MDRHPESLETVYRSNHAKACREHSLVLNAVGIKHEVRCVEGEFTLVVSAADAARSRTELEAYASENRNWPEAEPSFPQLSGGRVGLLGYVAVLVLVAVACRVDALGLDWFTAGKTHAGLIREGQWWRAVTALTLHVDGTHLLGNVLIGGLVGLFAGQMLGSGLAWLSILLAGTAGNLANAWIRPAGHTSVGASTAVFASLGLVAACAWWYRPTGAGRASSLARWAPIVGAVVLLSFLGTGGERTDVAAHVTGFLSGLILGALYGALGDRLRLGSAWQILLGVAALALIGIAWALALAPHGTPVA